MGFNVAFKGLKSHLSALLRDSKLGVHFIYLSLQVSEDSCPRRLK